MRFFRIRVALDPIIQTAMQTGEVLLVDTENKKIIARRRKKWMLANHSQFKITLPARPDNISENAFSKSV
ncbi:MAG: hypothetical protein ACD_42C00199G0002 [uncultured bacterium]|nr:MAG: hypothetical protein ACD_42C00199G0002 [uncultured bacterium]